MQGQEQVQVQGQVQGQGQRQVQVQVQGQLEMTCSKILLRVGMEVVEEAKTRLEVSMTVLVA